jgi:D-Tyr-tRNAtyr deacylase
MHSRAAESQVRIRHSRWPNHIIHGKGVLILAAVSRDDSEKEIESMAAKVLKTKLWDDESTDPVSRWKHNVKEIDGEVLCGTGCLL